MRAPLRTSQSSEDWPDAPVSPWSRFGEDEWQLDIRTAGRAAKDNKISWSVPLPSNVRISSIIWTGLIQAAKQFVWSMVVNPPAGRKRWSPSTVHGRAILLKVLIEWMAFDGLTAFQDIDAAAVERLRAWILVRSGRGKRAISPNTVVGYMMVLKDLYRQRAKLRDAILTDPLPEETIFEAAGLSPETRGAIPFIPDAIAIALLNAALKWVENHGPTIVEAETIRLKARVVGFDQGGRQKPAQYYVNRDLKRVALTGPSGEPLSNSYAVRHAVCRLVTACYILIAGFVGMRVSEILSMQLGAIEYHPIGETGVDQAYIVARLFKTSDEIGGRLERWLAPAPVMKAVGLLEQLNVPLREATGRSELFIMAKHKQRGEIAPVSNTYMNLRINEFARHMDIPLYDGKPWVFSSHQFRKTFARFIAQRDRTQLLGLSEHFKHVSVAMTSRGYVGSDFDLHQLIGEEAQAETAVALDRILASDRLAGRMGERIVAGNARFRGRAGEQVRHDYIEFVLEKTDLRVYACDYGWCVFQPETARCGGERAPNEASRSPAVCLSCANMVIEARHAPYWQDRRERNAALMPRASMMTAAVLAEAVEQCDQVLAKIEKAGEQI